MTATPKPPPGYPTWLDFAAETMSSDYFSLDVVPGTKTLMHINWAKAELAALRAERDKWRGLWGPYSYEIASAFLNNCDCAQCATSIIDSPDRFEIYCHDCSERGEAAVSALRAERDRYAQTLNLMVQKFAPQSEAARMAAKALEKP